MDLSLQEGRKMDERGTPLEIVLSGLAKATAFTWSGLFTTPGMIVALCLALGVWLAIRFGSED